MSIFKHLKKYKVNKLYHATYGPRLKSIKKHGLTSDGSLKEKTWCDSNLSYIYLANDPYAAESFCECSEMVDESWIDDIIVFEIDVSDLELDLLEIDENNHTEAGDETFQYRGTIPYNLLRRYKD